MTIAGNSVFVAGAGGYIGSALVKALAQEGAGSLVLLDSSEHGLFEIQRSMAAHYPTLPCESVLGSVGDEGLLREVFARFRPLIVFHAAAFKHVGFAEQNPFAAIENNALGSYHFAKAAMRHGAIRFVLISTDKAANPRSVMGVSKRLAELLTLSLSGVRAIRLCNVVGSPGSVVPLFLEQIEEGVALSVTHPDASRYFITRTEAVTAILAAASIEHGGNLLLPEVSTPKRIEDLARDLIGRRNLAIHFTGLNPGEKVTEDLIGHGESLMGTVEGPLTVVKTKHWSEGECEDAVRRLSIGIAQRDVGSLLDALSSLVPEYLPSELMLERAAAYSQA